MLLERHDERRAVAVDVAHGLLNEVGHEDASTRVLRELQGTDGVETGVLAEAEDECEAVLRHVVRNLAVKRNLQDEPFEPARILLCRNLGRSASTNKCADDDEPVVLREIANINHELRVPRELHARAHHELAH